MELLTDITSTEPAKYSQVILTQPDIQLDLYKLARRRGLLTPHMTVQLRQYLVAGFQALCARLIDLVPEMLNGTIFPQQSTSRVCFNYMSQWLRLPLLKCICFCLPEESRIELDIPGLHKLDNPAHLQLYKKIFNYLVLLKAREQILWFFFQVPNYCDYNIAGYRQVYEAMCAYLCECWPKALVFTSSDKQSFEQLTLGTTFYYNLVYHGQSNRQILLAFAKVLQHVYPELCYTAGHVCSNPVLSPSSNPSQSHIQQYKLKTDKGKYLAKCLEIYEREYITGDKRGAFTELDKLGQTTVRKIRVAFISNKLLTYTSVFRDRIGIITNLDRKYFECWVGLFGDEKVINAQIKADPVAMHFLDPIIKQGHVLYLSKTSVVNNQKLVAERTFDIIIYPDLGMVQAQTLLAHSRLAPVQITTWGHSDTSGCPEIDYYITSKWFEQTEDLAIPKANYSEKPILLNSMGTYYYSPRKIVRKLLNPQTCQPDPNPDLLTASLGFSAISTGKRPIIIGCLQSFYKFNEQFESVLESILKLTEPMSRGGHIVYLALSNSITFNKKHLTRLNAKLGPYTSRIKWFQNKTPVDWLNLVSICRVMIDPFPFGGCNTSLEAFDYGIPVVCYPSKRMINGRFTAGFYKKMGITHCIVDGPVQYTQQVMRLVQDDTYYELIRGKILDSKDCLFEEKESLLEYQNLLYTLLTKHFDKK